MHITARLAALPLLWIALGVPAQDVTHPLDRVPGCDRANASRLPAAECGFRMRDDVVIVHELDSTIRIAAPEMELHQCKAEVSIEYYQNDTVAEIDGEIENHDCAASGGSVELSIRTIDEDGAATSREILAPWRREDDQTARFSLDVEIGSNVDLDRVRARKASCKCNSPE